MSKQIIIAEQHKVAAVFSEDQIQELVVATGNQQVSDIYLGTVENVIPGIDAAFVNINDSEKNGFIHVTDLGPLRLKRSAGAITELLSPQQTVLVQVMKEPTGNKGPRLTGNITLPGRYLVLMPYGKGVNLSRRIKDENERSRLRALAILIKPAGMGLLVRTEAEGKDEEAIMEDLEFLQKRWESIQQQAQSTRPPALLNRDDDFIQRVLRDMYSQEVNRIVVDSPSAVKRVKHHLSNWGAHKSPLGLLIDHHRERQPILDYFRVNAAIKEALKPRVELPSGGYIIIEPTEALTVIDVNSGSFTRSATSRETVLWTNSEAATEIARQLRLRNIGGVIIVDFIDMDSRRDQLKLLEHFNKALRADKARPQIAQLSELGLVELTRKRQGQNIYELFGQPCSHCGGLGHLAYLPGKTELEPLEIVTPAVASASTPRPVIAPEPISLPTPAAFLESNNELEKPIPKPALDLLHHPSYQEQSNNSNRRHRRRRLSDVLAREESIEPVSYEANSHELTRDKDSSPGEERGKRNSPRSRREEPNLEKISVEMTPLEQEIYALMGVSPLVKLPDKANIDPKSVAVSVRLPGEEEEISPNRSANHVKQTKLIAETNKKEIKLRQNKLDKPKLEVESEEVQPIAIVEPTSEQISEETQSSELVNQQTELTEAENTSKIVRRRRRRSSALSH
ncbi:MAG: Rne/Rng family ribonuclease [Cyanobacteria bacterium J083]|nr:MAG: Rne/Rng family ribonuclease [Cyanobacteria bacterium J083]